MTIGERIKQRRIELGLSQDELSRKMGYKTRNAIYQFEQKDNMKLSLIEKFAEALDTTPAYLMGWDEQIKQVQEQLEPYTKKLSEYGKRISDQVSYELDLQNGLKVEIDKMAQNYEPEQLLRAFKFMEAFLMASSERQKIALEILQQPHQEDS